MPRDDETERTRFATVLRSIRKSRKESQENFAAQLNVSRSLIGNLETKGSPSTDFVKLLEKQFPEFSNEIKDAVQLTHKEVGTATPKSKHPAQLFAALDSLLATGRYEAAAIQIHSELDKEPDDTIAFELYRRFGRMFTLTGKYEESRVVLAQTIELGEKLSSTSDDELFAVWLDLITMLLHRNNQMAQSAIQDALMRFPAASAIWHHKGVAHLDEQEFASAYAALTIALQYSKTSAVILATRGRVLAEWGRPEDALIDLELAFGKPESKLAHLIEAHAALAFTHFQLGDHSHATSIFAALIEKDPRNAYTDYLIGISNMRSGDREKAILSFISALDSDGKDSHGPLQSNTLGPQRRRKADRWLKDLQAGRQPREPGDGTDYKHQSLTLHKESEIIPGTIKVRKLYDGS